MQCLLLWLPGLLLLLLASGGVVQGCRAALCFIVSQIAARCASQELWLCLFIIMQHASWRDQIIKVVGVVAQGSRAWGGGRLSERHLHNFVTWQRQGIRIIFPLFSCSFFFFNRQQNIKVHFQFDKCSSLCPAGCPVDQKKAIYIYKKPSASFHQFPNQLLQRQQLWRGKGRGKCCGRDSICST